MNVQLKGAFPGIWTADVIAARKQAVTDERPCIVVACKPLDQCSSCRRVAAVLESPAFMAAASSRGWFLAYLVKGIDAAWPSYIAGPALRLPILSVYAADGSLARRVSSDAMVAAGAQVTVPSICNLIDAMLRSPCASCEEPAPVKPAASRTWPRWMFWKR